MKKLFVVFSLLLAACAHTSNTNQSIRVVGIGNTFEAAKNSAFRDAIELKVGTMVLSERETVNYHQTRNDILVYSAGFVDDFKIINVVERNNRYYITMDVLVSSTKLSDRLLNSNNAITSFDGIRHQAQAQTIVAERKAQTAILSEVMNEYPKRAYVLKQKPYHVSVDSTNKTVLTVPYQLSFDYDWLHSVNAALIATNNNTNALNNFMNGMLISPPAEAIIISAHPNFTFLGDKKHYKITNPNNFETLRNAFENTNEVRIKMILWGVNNTVISNTCWTPVFLSGRAYTGSFYYTNSDKKFVLLGNSYENADIKIAIPNNFLQKINHIELITTNRGDCER